MLFVACFIRHLVKRIFANDAEINCIIEQFEEISVQLRYCTPDTINSHSAFPMPKQDVSCFFCVTRLIQMQNSVPYFNVNLSFFCECDTRKFSFVREFNLHEQLLYITFVSSSITSFPKIKLCSFKLSLTRLLHKSIRFNVTMRETHRIPLFDLIPFPCLVLERFQRKACQKPVHVSSEYICR